MASVGYYAGPAGGRATVTGRDAAGSNHGLPRARDAATVMRVDAPCQLVLAAATVTALSKLSPAADFGLPSR